MLCGPNYVDSQWALYRYEPSTPAAAAFSVLFGISTILHILQMWKTKTWYLTALCIGAGCEFLIYFIFILFQQ